MIIHPLKHNQFVHTEVEALLGLPAEWGGLWVEVRRRKLQLPCFTLAYRLRSARALIRVFISSDLNPEIIVHRRGEVRSGEGDSLPVSKSLSQINKEVSGGGGAGRGRVRRNLG